MWVGSHVEHTGKGGRVAWRRWTLGPQMTGLGSSETAPSKGGALTEARGLPSPR